MLVLILFYIYTECIPLVNTECAKQSSGLYCTNLIKNEKNNTLIFKTDPTEQEVKTIYLRNSSGEIVKETFSYHPKIKTLDIQFSEIDKFLPEAEELDTLIIMYSKFPTLTDDILKQCCQNFVILFIATNPELEIKTGAFKHMNKLIQLTISNQNITQLTKDFLDGLTSLTYLNLNKNEINTIEENSFENLSTLNHLVLTNNKFKSIETKTFENLKSLETLLLYGNDLKELNKATFSQQKQLRELGVPTSLIKNKLEFNQLTRIFPSLETIGIESKDKDDETVNEFGKICQASGFYLKFVENNEL